MKTTGSLTYKIADEEWQFEAIHRLNYRTFVEEIPQHDENPERRLVDKFHDENTYLICLLGQRLLGMVAVRSRRPFSLDQKLENLDSYLPPARSVCELRLLAVAPDARAGVVCHGLMGALRDYCRRRHDLGVISGTVRQLKLYRHLGFQPFGPLVGRAGAKFQPMYVTLEAVQSRLPNRKPAGGKIAVRRPSANFLPGPVAISAHVQRAFAERPRSHRGASFVADFKDTQRRLCELANANHVEILMGSGTLANDAIAAQLSLLAAPGLILSNGEFGARLVDHAHRFQLRFSVHEIDWGEAFHPRDIVAAIARNPRSRWLWAVHCETSTGVLNELAMLKKVCAVHDMRLALDCVSSIGAVPLDLAGVFLASASSGKALGSFPGLAMVFHESDFAAAPNHLPRALDLDYYACNDGIPFTLSSNLLDALSAALDRYDPNDYTRVATLAAWLRAELRDMGAIIVGDNENLSPAVTTIALPANLNSRILGAELEDAGYLLSYRSGYLAQRNWLQICLMGEIFEAELRALVDALRRVFTATVTRPASAPAAWRSSPLPAREEAR
ncbi:MAG: aminotransferase class V-fold PLP-dependent enzyme [Deltaproteobacteria bacterium]|nr:aminotransferase class V-fold PLP-dependent enzyme [Deltaproteobacteria bacterium]